MTDSQQLLVEYAKNGSESAFRELVSRYSNLVYSTALRLVSGDTHLAEDIAQTVFMGLASKGRALSTEVLLGGWLHQHTYHVAMMTLRADRRRQSREREAVEMNILQDDSGADWREVAPILDEAITRLGSVQVSVLTIDTTPPPAFTRFSRNATRFQRLSPGWQAPRHEAEWFGVAAPLAVGQRHGLKQSKPLQVSRLRGWCQQRRG